MVNETSPLSAAKPLDAFPDAALVRVIAAAPALDQATGMSLLQGIDRLFAQFAREGRVDVWARELIEDGVAVVFAWQGPPLSGCSHDKLNGLLAHHERDGRSLISAPPIAIRTSVGWRLGTRAALRSWIASGEVTASDRYLDRTVATLGAWRSGGLIALGDSPLAALL